MAVARRSRSLARHEARPAGSSAPTKPGPAKSKGEDTNPIPHSSHAAVRASATVRIALRRLDGNDDLPVPEPATAGSAGVDLRAAVLAPLELAPGERALVPTGFAVALPVGYEGQVRPRSGLALKLGVTLLNSPGTIDSDYRGEVAVVMVNLGQKPVAVRRGDRIAQLVIAPVTRPAFDVVAELPESGRGAGGFGHTGDQ
jgi:dUTP pyrophosphatase